jgi:GntR family transcriptional regulator/MocR family aminotransferase
MFAMDGAGRVVFLGSFNKALAPGLRVGYAVVPMGLAAQLVPKAEQLSSPLVNTQQQLLLARFWNEGHLAAHLRQLREVHARRRALLIEALRLEAHGVLNLEGPPEAGLRLPLCLDGAMEDARIVDACQTQGLRVGRPISSCYVSAPLRAGFCVGFASTPDSMIQNAVRRLVEITRAQLSRHH